jgi:hypothetical protein
MQFICSLVLQVIVVGGAELSLWSSAAHHHSILDFCNEWRIYLFVGGLFLQVLDACYTARIRKPRRVARKSVSHHNSERRNHKSNSPSHAATPPNKNSTCGSQVNPAGRSQDSRRWRAGQ